MAAHVKILGILHIAFGALGILVALVILLVFGGIAGIVGHSGEPDAAIAVPILGGIGGIIFLLVLAFSLPGLVVGIGLVQLRPWARMGGIIVSALHLIHIPFGTALGIYGLWALLNPEAEQMFSRPQMAGY